MTIDEWIKAELDRTGKTCYTLDEVEQMTERWIQYKQAAAAFEGWKDATVDQLMGVKVKV